MTGKQRLRVLYNYLKSGAVDENEFDMYGWPTCAIGEATRIPSLKAEGLSMNGEPQFRHLKSYHAIAQFFGLTHDIAFKIFNGANREPLKKVVTKIGNTLRHKVRA